MKKLFKYSLSPLLLNLSVNGALERSQGLVIMIALPLCFSFDETGVYQFYLISATLIASICTFGLPQVVLSQISEMQKKDQNVYQKYFVDIHFVIIITVFLVTVIIGGLEEIIFRSQALLILSTNISNALIFFLGIGLWASCLAGDQMCNALITGRKEFKYLKKGKRQFENKF
jgi:O-antigen/teichoic acid export membrane protein